MNVCTFATQCAIHAIRRHDALVGPTNRRNDGEAERIVDFFGARGYQISAVVEHESTHRLATARLVAKAAPPVLLDLLFASSGIESEVAANAELLEILPGLTVPVASTGHLMALKLLARDDRRRPQGEDDFTPVALGG